jgi:multidrug resistance efflux pump
MKRAIIFVLLLSAALAWAYQQHLKRAPGVLQAYGTLEARNIEIGSKVGGRVIELGTHEGERVEAGQVLVTLDDDQLAPAVALAEAQLAAARAELAKLEHGSRREDIAEARAAAGDKHSGFRVDEIAQARAERARLDAEAVNAEQRLTRTRDLLARGMVAQQAYDDALAGADAARAAVRAASHALAAAEGRYSAALAVTERTVTGSRVEDVDAARAQVAQAEAQLTLARSRLAERQVRAPRDAMVEVFDLRPGDLVAANATIARLLEVDQLYVMVYVPEPRIGEVRLGQRVDIEVDAYPARTFHGKIEQIRQRAEFLPRNVQTREERVHQVIGVKVRVEDPQSELRAGTAAEVLFTAAAP